MLHVKVKNLNWPDKFKCLKMNVFYKMNVWQTQEHTSTCGSDKLIDRYETYIMLALYYIENQKFYKQDSVVSNFCCDIICKWVFLYRPIDVP